MRAKIDHIDSLRGIAILMVLLVHTSQSLPGLSGWLNVVKYGQMGVQLFFVVSAFTLCLSMERREHQQHPLGNFFIRRVFRIVPLYEAGLIFYFLVWTAKSSIRAHSVVIPSQYTLGNVVANFTITHGFYPPGNNNIVPGGWSIGTEMAFYLLFPLLFLGFKGLRSRGLRLCLAAPLFFLAGSCAVHSALYLVFGIAVQNDSFLYYNLLTQLPVFAAGMALYFLRRGEGFTHLPASLSPWCFVGLTAAAMALWKSQITLAFAVVPFLSALSFVFLYDVFERRAWLNPKILQRIGQLSYSIYIVHFFFALELCTQISKLSVIKALPREIAFVCLYSIALGLSFLAALVTERLIEKPAIAAGRHIIGKRERTPSLAV